MFPRNLNTKDNKDHINSHYSVYFTTPLSKNRVVESINERGIAGFIDPDRYIRDQNNNITCWYYDDSRINTLQTANGADCCAFTRDHRNWYLFPIHKKELAMFDLNEQHLLEWITFLNTMEVGFEYLYFGEQELPDHVKSGGPKPFRPRSERADDTKYYWVGVPSFRDKHIIVSYLHWVCLRYLINSHRSENGTCPIPVGDRVGYYKIPRIATFFHEELGLPKIKAFLYAHIVHPFYSGNSMVYSDYMGLDSGNVNCMAPCVDLTTEQFKEIWSIRAYNESLNGMLTQRNYENNSSIRYIKGLDGLYAPYDTRKIQALFMEGKFQEIVNHIEESYKLLKEKRNAGKETVNR